MKNYFNRKTVNCEFCGKRVKRGIANYAKHISEFHTKTVEFSLSESELNINTVTP